MRESMVSVAEILGRPGEYRDVPIAQSLEGVEMALAHLEARPLTGTLRLESVVEGVLVTGSVAGRVGLECARCLTAFTAPLEVQVCELFAAPGHEGDPDAYRVAGSEIDLEPMLRDAAGLELPLNPLCQPECAGLCARCGKDLNQGACGCVEESSDPRWDALSELRARLESHTG